MEEIKSTKSEDLQSYHAKPFIKFFSPQAGTCIVAVVGGTLMLTVMIYNIFSENRFATFWLQFAQYFFVYSYSLTMFIGFGISSCSAFLLSGRLLEYGYYINLFGFVYWITITIIGFIPSYDTFTFVCIDNRCPETHWLYDTRWRNYGFSCPTEGGTEAKETYETYEKNLSAYYSGCENYSPLPMACSIILCLAWIVFIVYGLYTYKQFDIEMETEVSEEDKDMKTKINEGKNFK